MPFDYEGAKAAGYTDEEINGFLSKAQSAPSAPSVVQGNIGATQKYLEGYGAEAGKKDVEKQYQDVVRSKIGGSLDAVAAGLEEMQKTGGYNPMYDNESLLFGVLPGVKPTVQYLRSQDMADLPLIGDVGKALTSREAQQSKVGALAAQLKSVIRQPGEGTWTDADQRFLMQILPQGAGYETDKKIIEGLRNGTLINSIQQYKQSPEWQYGLKTEAQPVAPSTDNPKPVSWEEYFK